MNMNNEQMKEASYSHYNKLTKEKLDECLLEMSNNARKGSKLKYDITKYGHVGNGLYCIGGVAYTGKRGWDQFNKALLDELIEPQFKIELKDKYYNDDTFNMKDNNLYNNNNLSHRCNFINPTKTMAISSYGEVFKIGAHVAHEDKNAPNAIIESFEVDEESNEIIAFTDKGYCHIDFMYNLHSDDGIVVPSEDEESCTNETISTYAIEEIKKERLEQINKHKFGMFHDLEWRNSELVKAAFYCIEPGTYDWPRVLDKKYEDKIDERDLLNRLIVAGAFIAAEIDRLKSVEYIREEAKKELEEVSVNEIEL